MQLLDNNEKETFMDSFPQVDPRYGKVLPSRRIKGHLSGDTTLDAEAGSKDRISEGPKITVGKMRVKPILKRNPSSETNR